jgi:hypothetical protein
MKKIVGILLIASPFVGIFAAAVWEQGWGVASACFVGAALVVAVILLGVHLLRS